MADQMATERRKATESDHRLYQATPRGIGKGWGACMVCGGDAGELRHDCAFFVPSRETGEAIVALFQYGAKLDYRPSEPQWCQVKITACDEHLSNLEALVGSVSGTQDRRDGPGISVEMVAEFAARAAAPPAVTVPIAWMCEDLILSDGKPLITQDREHAERRAEVIHEGKPAWRVTPVYAAALSPQPAQVPDPADEPDASKALMARERLLETLRYVAGRAHAGLAHGADSVSPVRAARDIADRIAALQSVQGDSLTEAAKRIAFALFGLTGDAAETFWATLDVGYRERYLSAARSVSPAQVVEAALPKEPTEAHLSAIWSALGWRKCESAINEARIVYQALRRAALRSGETSQAGELVVPDQSDIDAEADRMFGYAAPGETSHG